MTSKNLKRYVFSSSLLRIFLIDNISHHPSIFHQFSRFPDFMGSPVNAAFLPPLLPETNLYALIYMGKMSGFIPPIPSFEIIWRQENPGFIFWRNDNFQILFPFPHFSLYEQVPKSYNYIHLLLSDRFPVQLSNRIFWSRAPVLNFQNLRTTLLSSVHCAHSCRNVTQTGC